jgi:hypothetical protein
MVIEYKLHIDEAVVWPGRFRHLILVVLHPAARGAAMAGHEHQVSPNHLRRPDHGREDTR